MSNIRWAQIACTVALFCVAAVSAPAQTFTTLTGFNGTNGANPNGSPLVQGTDGNFYGTTYFGGTPTTCFYSAGTGCGTVFKMTPAGEITSLYSFCSQANCTDGANPVGLIQASDGNFYGVAEFGGLLPASSECCGTIFQITPSGTLTTLYRFCSKQNCTDGERPVSLLQASNGNFYGVTFYGGAHKLGTVFEFTAAGTLRTMHSFCALSKCSDGSDPVALMEDSNRNFYGSTYGGGTFGAGLIFEITPAGKVTNLVESVRKPNGVIQGTNGDLYGTTYAGGDGDHGIVFRMTLAGKRTNLHGFCAQDCATGDSPLSALVQGSDGNFYGTTSEAGNTYYAGSVYQITPTGTFTTLYLFCSLTDCADGYEGGAMMQATNGNFYGVTAGGGPGTAGGTVFSLSMGLGPFVAARPGFGSVGQTITILGNNLTGTTSVTFNGVAATFTAGSDTYIQATVPTGATTGTIEVTTPTGTLSSNVAFRVLP
jgi:uncharacterized repeat protein (TIGR03803 family)